MPRLAGLRLSAQVFEEGWPGAQIFCQIRNKVWVSVQTALSEGPGLIVGRSSFFPDFVTHSYFCLPMLCFPPCCQSA